MTVQVVPVGLITSYIRQLLDTDPVLSDVWVEGEVSNRFTSRSGHVYFTLSDGESQIKCVLFRSLAQRQRLLPSPGDQIAAHGRVSLYERDGTYQLYADVIEHAGQGLMALQFERLRQKLEADGLFDVARKRPLPPCPRNIAVVTSAEGAVWHDIQTVLRRRYPLAHLILSACPVQGAGAPDGIVAAIERVMKDGRAELLIVARGGGSSEDLACFNDERVARAVFASRIPVISAIGHENDWTIIDLVADLRAATPSAAAELCAPSIESLRDVIDDGARRLQLEMGSAMSDALEEIAQETRRIERYSPERRLQSAREEVARLRNEARSIGDSAVRSQRAGIAGLARELRLYGWESVKQRRMEFSHSVAVLAALQPAKVLQRGYAAIEVEATGAPILSVDDVQVGTAMVARMTDGSLAGVVRRVDAEPWTRQHATA